MAGRRSPHLAGLRRVGPPPAIVLAGAIEQRYATGVTLAWHPMWGCASFGLSSAASPIFIGNNDFP